MGNGSLGAGLLGGVIGTVLGGGLTLALRPAPDAAPQPTTAELRAAFSEALEPLLEQMRTPRSPAGGPRRPRVAASGDRSASPSQAESTGASVDPVAPTPHVGGTREMPGTNDAGPWAPVRTEGTVWTPAPNYERVRELDGFDEDIRLRQRWMFLTEREALATFGTPDTVWLSENGENWSYSEPDVETEDEIIHGESWTLVFSRGRLVQVYD